jgi:hypothetical protein
LLFLCDGARAVENVIKWLTIKGMQLASSTEIVAIKKKYVLLF